MVFFIGIGLNLGKFIYPNKTRISWIIALSIRRFQNNFCRIISVINRIELLAWKTKSNHERLLKLFLQYATEYPLSEKIIDKTVEIRKNQKIRLPDAIIAATCIVHKLTILTDNELDFKKIEQIKIINPVRDLESNN